MKNLIKLAALSVIVFVSSCRKDDETPRIGRLGAGEVEEATKIEITFTNAANSAEVVRFTYTDPDLDGPTAAKFERTGNLKPNTEYLAEFTQIFNEIDNENLLEEIKEEDEEHQFYYDFPEGTANISYLPPNDGDGNPLGTKFTFTTGTQQGNFRVILVHQGDKSKNNTSQPWRYSEQIGTQIDFDLTFENILQ